MHFLCFFNPHKPCFIIFLDFLSSSDPRTGVHRAEGNKISEMALLCLLEVLFKQNYLIIILFIRVLTAIPLDGYIYRPTND